MAGGTFVSSAQRSLFGDDLPLPARRVREPPKEEVFRPHPEGPVRPVPESKRERLDRWCRLKTWVYARRWHADTPETREACRRRGQANRNPVLILAWLANRKCPVCGRRILPQGAAAESDSLVLLVLQHFCGDVCSRYAEDLGAPTRDEIRAAAAAERKGWSEERRLAALRFDWDGWRAATEYEGGGDD